MSSSYSSNIRLFPPARPPATTQKKSRAKAKWQAVWRLKGKVMITCFLSLSLHSGFECSDAFAIYLALNQYMFGQRSGKNNNNNKKIQSLM
jgi:hypothetical protein